MGYLLDYLKPASEPEIEAAERGSADYSAETEAAWARAGSALGSGGVGFAGIDLAEPDFEGTDFGEIGWRSLDSGREPGSLEFRSGAPGTIAQIVAHSGSCWDPRDWGID